MSKLVTNTRAQTVYQYLTKHKDGLAAALPKHVTADRLIRVAYNAIAQNPTLQSCSAESLQRAVIQSSILGLEINSPLGEAWLVPYKGNATLIIDYRGLINLARRTSGMVVYAEIHRQKDAFKMKRGTNPEIIHEIDPTTERGDIKGYYAVYKTKDGSTDFEYMTVKEIEKVKNISKAKKEGTPWAEWPEEMAKKTVIRRLLKRAPKSVEVAKAVELDNQAVSGQPQTFDDIIDITPGQTKGSDDDKGNGSADKAEQPAPSEGVSGEPQDLLGPPGWDDGPGAGGKPAA